MDEQNEALRASEPLDVPADEWERYTIQILLAIHERLGEIVPTKTETRLGGIFPSTTRTVSDRLHERFPGDPLAAGVSASVSDKAVVVSYDRMDRVIKRLEGVGYRVQRAPALSSVMAQTLEDVAFAVDELKRLIDSWTEMKRRVPQ